MIRPSAAFAAFLLAALPALAQTSSGNQVPASHPNRAATQRGATTPGPSPDRGVALQGQQSNRQVEGMSQRLLEQEKDRPGIPGQSDSPASRGASPGRPQP